MAPAGQFGRAAGELKRHLGVAVFRMGSQDGSFKTIDCEGLVFTTICRDSWGAVVVDACD